jgi:hypothetical protein
VIKGSRTTKAARIQGQCYTEDSARHRQRDHTTALPQHPPPIHHPRRLLPESTKPSKRARCFFKGHVIVGGSQLWRMGRSEDCKPSRNVVVKRFELPSGRYSLGSRHDFSYSETFSTRLQVQQANTLPLHLSQPQLRDLPCSLLTVLDCAQSDGG